MGVNESQMRRRAEAGMEASPPPIRCHVTQLVVPGALLRKRREEMRLSQRALADAMTEARREVTGDESDWEFGLLHISSMELGRGNVRVGSDKEPLWWALRVLGLPVEVVFVEEPAGT